MLTLPSSGNATWAAILICPPGADPVTGGILLIDRSKDTLYVRVHTDLAGIDADTREILTFLAEAVENTAAERGAAMTLSQFEKDWSNTLRLTEPQTIDIEGDPGSAVDRLFRDLVLQNHSSSDGIHTPDAPVFTEADLVSARELLPLSSVIAIQTLNALNDQSISMQRLELIVSKDPLVAAHLVRLANSAIYSHGGQVRSIAHALLRLGTDVARTRIAALMIKQAFVTAELRTVWNHSVDVAQLAHSISSQLPDGEPEATFLAALIHDIGQVSLLNLTGFTQHSRALRSKGYYPIQIEQQLCHSTHAQIGADILASWNFPLDMVEAVRYHHTPGRSKLALTSILYLAESWTENDEDIYDPSEHDQISKLLKVNRGDRIKGDVPGDLTFQVLRFSASA